MTMRRNNAGYFIRQGLRGLSSHRFFTFAAIGIIAACLIVTGSVALVAVNLEYTAELQYRALCIGSPRVLSDGQMAAVRRRFASYGQPGGEKGGY